MYRKSNIYLKLYIFLKKKRREKLSILLCEVFARVYLALCIHFYNFSPINSSDELVRKIRAFTLMFSITREHDTARANRMRRAFRESSASGMTRLYPGGMLNQRWRENIARTLDRISSRSVNTSEQQLNVLRRRLIDL